MKTLATAIAASLTLCFAILANPAHGVLLRDFQPKPGQKIGIFIGTFDPPHQGHHATLMNAMKAAHLDYVVVIPNKDALHKPDATPAEMRAAMLRANYETAPDIVIPYSTEEGNPLQLMKQVRAKAERLELVGIFGDDILDPNLKNRISGWLSSGYFDSAVIQTRGSDPGKAVDPSVRLWNKPTTYIDSVDGGMSSTKVRRYIQAHPEVLSARLNASERVRIASELKVTPEVFDIIRGNALYTTVNASPCARFFRALGNVLEPK